MPDNNDSALIEYIAMLEGRIAALESREPVKYDEWLNLIENKISQISSDVLNLKNQVENNQSINDNSTDSDIGDVGHTIIMPDGNTSRTTSPHRKTIEYQPGSGAHQNELQLVNTDTLPTGAASFNMPYFDSNSSGDGELKWFNLNTGQETSFANDCGGLYLDGTTNELKMKAFPPKDSGVESVLISTGGSSGYYWKPLSEFTHT